MDTSIGVKAIFKLTRSSASRDSGLLPINLTGSAIRSCSKDEGLIQILPFETSPPDLASVGRRLVGYLGHTYARRERMPTSVAGMPRPIEPPYARSRADLLT